MQTIIQLDEAGAETVTRLLEFERATLRPVSDKVDYEPGYIQIYPEGAAMRQIGLTEAFDRLTLFFKNLALDREGAVLPEVAAAVQSRSSRIS